MNWEVKSRNPKIKRIMVQTVETHCYASKMC